MGKLDALYSEKTTSIKRNIIMDMLGAILEAQKLGPNPEVWKLHIDGALDRLESDVYLPIIEEL